MYHLHLSVFGFLRSPLYEMLWRELTTWGGMDGSRGNSDIALAGSSDSGNDVLTVVRRQLEALLCGDETDNHAVLDPAER